jgi:hypothetical protein
MYLAHQRAADIKAGDQLFYKFRRYLVHEVTVHGPYVRVVGTGERDALYVLLAAGRKLWSLKKREQHDPLHGLRGRHVPVQRQPALPGVHGDQHLPVLSRDHVAGASSQHEALVEPGVLAIRTLIGTRIRPTVFGEVPQVPYVLSVAGSSLIPALHTGRRPGFGVEGGGQALGERSMVPDLRTAFPQAGGSTLGRDWTSTGTIRIVIPPAPQERDDQGIPTR